mmetsp:Transcript_30948/g.54276  ORF Transcript_30948/g.54276 Transcript_30948/m.54276 type:complete len:190 (-) Transcript_30948:49-618(-)
MAGQSGFKWRSTANLGAPPVVGETEDLEAETGIAAAAIEGSDLLIETDLGTVTDDQDAAMIPWIEAGIVGTVIGNLVIGTVVGTAVGTKIEIQKGETRTGGTTGEMIGGTTGEKMGTIGMKESKRTTMTTSLRVTMNLMRGAVTTIATRRMMTEALSLDTLHKESRHGFIMFANYEKQRSYFLCASYLV